MPPQVLIANNAAQGILSSFFFKFAGALQGHAACLHATWLLQRAHRSPMQPRYSSPMQPYAALCSPMQPYAALSGIICNHHFGCLAALPAPTNPTSPSTHTPHADTILKKYSSTVATIFTALMSWALFGHTLTMNFLLGVSIVFVSMHQFFTFGRQQRWRLLAGGSPLAPHAEADTAQGRARQAPLQRHLSILSCPEARHSGSALSDCGAACRR
jgi:hypothetical protein